MGAVAGKQLNRKHVRNDIFLENHYYNDHDDHSSK